MIKVRWKQLSCWCRRSHINQPIWLCVIEISTVLLIPWRHWYWLITLVVHQDLEVGYRSLILSFCAADNRLYNYPSWQQKPYFAQWWPMFRSLTDVCGRIPQGQLKMRMCTIRKFFIFSQLRAEHHWILIAGCSKETNCYKFAQEFCKKNLSGQGEIWP